MDIAVTNAKLVLSEFENRTPAKAESATTVYELVEQLKRFI